jgi:hypothetical protein
VILRAVNSISLQLSKTDFKGGETVEGQLELSIEESIPARGVRVFLQGWELARWSTGTGKSRRTYSERNTLFEEELTLHGQPKLTVGDLIKDSLVGFFAKDKYEQIAPGQHSYPFSYTLPLILPGDYKSPGRSEIRYRIRGYVDVPLKFDLEAVQDLTVYEVFQPENVIPLSASNTKSFLFDSGAALSVKASLIRNVFFLGETVSPILEINNQSSKPVEAVELKLRQIETLRADDTGTTEEYEAASEMYREGKVDPGKIESFEPEFAIPSDLYPSIRSGSLVKVNYELTFRLHVPWAADLRLSLPIVLLERAGAPSGRTE